MLQVMAITHALECRSGKAVQFHQKLQHSKHDGVPPDWQQSPQYVQHVYVLPVKECCRHTKIYTSMSTCSGKPIVLILKSHCAAEILKCETFKSPLVNKQLLVCVSDRQYC